MYKNNYVGVKKISGKKKYLLTCIDCGDIREVYYSEIYGNSSRYVLNKGIYRCRKCWDIKRTGVPITHKKVEFVLKCVFCGREKKVKRSYYKARNNPYYCIHCFNKVKYLIDKPHYKSKKITSKTDCNLGGKKVEVVCPNCGKIRYYRPSQAKKVGLYCIKCMNKGERSSFWKGGDVKLTCYICGKITIVSPSAVKFRTRKDGKYYCRECALRNKPSGPDNSAWKGGISFEPYPIEWTNKVRESIRNRDNFKCRLCGEIEPNLCVHHIDYNKENLHPRNLISLCRSCHTKTNFNRSFWQKKLAELNNYIIMCLTDENYMEMGSLYDMSINS